MDPTFYLAPGMVKRAVNWSALGRFGKGFRKSIPHGMPHNVVPFPGVNVARSAGVKPIISRAGDLARKGFTTYGNKLMDGGMKALGAGIIGVPTLSLYNKYFRSNSNTTPPTPSPSQPIPNINIYQNTPTQPQPRYNNYPGWGDYVDPRNGRNVPAYNQGTNSNVPMYTGRNNYD